MALPASILLQSEWRCPFAGLTPPELWARLVDKQTVAMHIFLRFCLSAVLLLGFSVKALFSADAHPHLYLNQARIGSLKDEIASTKKLQWEILRNRAGELARRPVPIYKGAQQNDDPEQLWQRDVGSAIPNLAMACLLTGDRTYCDAAKAWARAACGYETWGLARYNGVDLAAAHQLYGLALGYDWLYDQLDASDRTLIRKTLLERGRTMYRALDAKTGASWRDEFLQNHMWVAMGGLAAAALAIPEEPETAQWLKAARDKFRRTEDALGPDGASQEGVGYWTYGVEYLLKFWSLSADLFGEDLRSAWWKRTSLYRIYLGLPVNALTAKSTIVDIADSERQDYYGPDYLLFDLARRFRDGRAQWLGLELEKRHLTVNVAPFLNLLWFDPTVSATPLNDLPTMHHFDDIGIVAARSDWSGNESLVVFKCGPPAGHAELEKGFTTNPGLGHVHPDANHFLVFANGKWVIQDDGYRWKETGQHNTLLVDGNGQDGEHNHWFGRKLPLPVKGEPTILAAESTPTFDFFAGDATGAYKPETGLRHFVRRVIFWKPSIVLVLDDIETDHARDLELRFHPADAKAAQIVDLTPDQVTTNEGIVQGKNRDGQPFPHMVAMRRNAAKWRNVVAISWNNSNGTASQAAPSVTMTAKGDDLLFQSGANAIGFSWKTGQGVVAITPEKRGWRVNSGTSEHDQGCRAGMRCGRIDGLTLPESEKPRQRANAPENTCGGERLNYVPNRIARSLVTGDTNTLGLIISDIRNPFFAEMVRGVEDAAYRAGYDLVLCNSDLHPEKQLHYIESLAGKDIDGIIVNWAAGLDREQEERLVAYEIPIVLLNSPAAVTMLSTVSVDNLEGGFSSRQLSVAIGPSQFCDAHWA